MFWKAVFGGCMGFFIAMAMFSLAISGSNERSYAYFVKFMTGSLRGSPGVLFFSILFGAVAGYAWGKISEAKK